MFDAYQANLEYLSAICLPEEESDQDDDPNSQLACYSTIA